MLGNWPRLLQFATCLSGAVLSFVWVPARLTLADASGSDTVKVVQFVIAVVAGLVMILVSLKAFRPSVWVVSCILAFLAGLYALNRYDALSARWTCSYFSGPPLVIGETLKPQALRYMGERPDASCSDLLRDFAGDNMRVWSEQEVRERHRNLRLMFSAVVVAFSLTIMFLLEAFRSAARLPPGRR